MRIRLVRFGNALISMILLALAMACSGSGESLPNVQERQETFSPRAGAAFTPSSGLWWNPQQSGRGFTLELQGTQIFMAMYGYETGGTSTWYAGTLTQLADGRFNGTLGRYSNGQTLLGAYRAPTGPATVGNATLTFTSSTQGTLSIQPADGAAQVIVAIERFSFSTPALSASTGTFESGYWWNEGQSGRGFFVEAQGSQATIAAYMYDSSGQPVWYLSSGAVQGGTTLAGGLQVYSGGQSLTGAYRAPTLSGTSAGSITFLATSRTTANLTLPSGETVSLKRLSFNTAAATTVPPPAAMTFKMFASSSASGPWTSQTVNVTGVTEGVGLVDPSPILMPDGSILLYYLISTVGGVDPGTTQVNSQWKMGVAKSSDNGLSYQHQGMVFTFDRSTTDPFPMLLANGTIRLLVSQGSSVVSVSASDATGLRYAASQDAGQRSVNGGIPGALRIGSTYYLYTCGNGGIQYATSTDGLTFASGPVVIATGSSSIVCDPSPIDAGNGTYLMAFKRRAAGGTGPSADTTYLASSNDGVRWTEGPAVGSGGVPGLVRDRTGTYRMYIPSGQ